MMQFRERNLTDNIWRKCSEDAGAHKHALR